MTEQEFKEQYLGVFTPNPRVTKLIELLEKFNDNDDKFDNYTQSKNYHYYKRYLRKIGYTAEEFREANRYIK